MSCLLHARMCVLCVILFFFFKQKTAYEMRISDWSSDVCSSDLDGVMVHAALSRSEVVIHYQPQYDVATGAMTGVEALLRWQHPELGLLGAGPLEIGRASCRERVCQSV